MQIFCYVYLTLQKFIFQKRLKYSKNSNGSELRGLKGSVSRDFRPPFFMFQIRIHLGPIQTVYFIFKFGFRFRKDIRSQSSKNSTPQCAWHHGVNILGLANLKNVLQIFSFMIDVFTPKRISLDCPFKSNQRLTKILILTSRCDAHHGAWLRGEMHTAELFEKYWSLDSAVGCTPRSNTNNVILICNGSQTS